MGTLGLGKLEEILVGSNTQKVIRYAKCPGIKNIIVQLKGFRIIHKRRIIAPHLFECQCF